MGNPQQAGFGEIPDLPIAISCIGNRYLLFDVKIVSYLRRKHQLCGSMIGTLPQSPSQNLFLGLPVQIMPEEAQLLVEKGVAFILDDARAHDEAFHAQNEMARTAYLKRVQKQTSQVEKLKSKEQDDAKRKALSKMTSSNATPRAIAPSKAVDLLSFDEADGTALDNSTDAEHSTHPAPNDQNPTNESPIKLMTNPATTNASSYHVTLTTSRLLVPSSTQTPSTSTPAPTQIRNLPASYPLYAHLHNKGYYITPGLRFGCQYAVYPGDPLRFHSHFLAVGRDWDEEFDLMDLVGGGRLGTGVKKGFLIGGLDPRGGRTKSTNLVRTFSVEWAAM